MTSPADTTGAQDDAPLILVVDDSRVMRQALNKILSRRYQVVDAPDGLEAWALLEQNPGITCVFTDLSMPQLDGYGLLQRIRESDDARLKALPVVIVTGNEDDEGTRRKAAERGANGVVMKPFRADHVLSTTEQLLAGGESAPAPTPAPQAEPTPRPAPEPHPDTAGLQAAQAETRSLREQLENAQAQARAAVKERERLQGDMHQLRTELMLRQQTSDEREAKDRIAALEADLAKGRESLEEAERVNGQLRTRLREQQEEASRAQERLEGLQGELQEASAQLLERDGQAREASAARDRAQEEIDALRREIEQQRQEYVGGDPDEVRRLKAELESARERTGAAERALASSSGQASGGESQDNLQARAEAAELARLQVEDELVQAISRVERMEQEREASKGEARTLRGELNLLQKKYRGRERQEAEKRKQLESQLSEALDALERSVSQGAQKGTPEPSAGPAASGAHERPAAPDSSPTQSARDTSVHRWEENQQRRRFQRNLALAGVGVVALMLLAFLLGGALL